MFFTNFLFFSFIASLGPVFEWVIKDINNKLIILDEHQCLDPVNYESIQSMIDYEVKTQRIRNKETTVRFKSGKLLPNGCRTLLRLHRSLGFISSFLNQIRIAPDDASSASIAWNAYSSTLGHYHSWPVKHTYEDLILLRKKKETLSYYCKFKDQILVLIKIRQLKEKYPRSIFI